MSVTAAKSENQQPPDRWRLWVDGCGGYLLLTGSEWEVGGASQSPPAISARADWPRRAGKILRVGQDYFWQPSHQQDRSLIIPGQPVPINGSATMTLNCPSPLSSSATLSLAAPHRFEGHVDGIILVDQTVLIGPQTDCHVRASRFDDRAVVLHKEGIWQAKLQKQSTRTDLNPGARIALESLVMTLERA